ncbi:MAG TPA: Lsr2 family protein [Sphingomicrobium sp.]|nr:Lsr2 family protein [Sphingomicrobium sp.]
MAQQVLVQMVDDIDGATATQTVPFALDGIVYEIDLSDSNAVNLREGLARFVGVARRVGGRKIRSTTGQTATAVPRNDESGKIRAWARENGWAVSDRGRIPASVVAAYEQAQQEAVAPEPAKATRKRVNRKKVASTKA